MRIRQVDTSARIMTDKRCADVAECGQTKGANMLIAETDDMQLHDDFGVIICESRWLCAILIESKWYLLDCTTGECTIPVTIH